MTIAEFKRYASCELKSFYNILIALHYLKKAKKHIHSDLELSKSYAKVADIYDERSKNALQGSK